MGLVAGALVPPPGVAPEGMGSLLPDAGHAGVVWVGGARGCGGARAYGVVVYVAVCLPRRSVV